MKIEILLSIGEHFKFRPINRDDVSFITGWRYESPWDFYHTDHPPSEVDFAYYLDRRLAFYIVTREDDPLPIAFCSFGDDGQVAGGDYHAVALDIGMGIRPDLTGQGLGTKLVPAVCDFADRTFAASTLRVSIAAFNERALKVWRKAGFEEVSRFFIPGRDVEFVILSSSNTSFSGAATQ